MGSFFGRGTFRAAAAHMVAGVTDIALRVVDGVVQVFTTTRAGGGLLSLELQTTGVGLRLIDQAGVAAGTVLSAPAQITVLSGAGPDRLIWTGGSVLGSHLLGRAGGIGAAETGALPSGPISAQTFATLGDAAFAILAPLGENRLLVCRMTATGQMVAVGGTDLGNPVQQAVDITALAALRIGAAHYVLSLSAAEESLRVWALGPNGTLTAVSQVGAGAGLGLSTPSALEVVELAGRSYALVAGAGSSSISVVALEPGGQMRLADHVIDTLETRFQGVQALASVQISGRVFVFAGGGDGGLQAFELMPGGRLVAAGQVLPATALPLDDITALAAVVQGDRIELVVGAEGSGLIRLGFDPGPLAVPLSGGAGDDSLSGGDRGDLILGRAGNDRLSGGAGADILSDGAGMDEMNGGAGADLFVLAADGQADTIRGFVPGEDRLDLSGWGRIYAVEALPMVGRRGCIVIRWGEEALYIYSVDGTDMDPGIFTSADVFGLWHVTTPAIIPGRQIASGPDRETLTGGGGADTLLADGGGDLLSGGSGRDLADYGRASGPVRANLGLGPLAPQLAGQDRFQSVEDLAGGIHDDTLTGNAADNLLLGRQGNDRLIGGAGRDRLMGGAGDDSLNSGLGADLLDGGDGRDWARWHRATTSVQVDLTLAVQSGGAAAGDRLIGIENLLGGRYADRLAGDATANALSGGGGSDRLEGRAGADTLNGGEGNDSLIGGSGADLLLGGAGADWAVYAGAAAVRVDLALAGQWQDTAGQGRDWLSGVEHLSGGAGGDRLAGGRTANILSGDAGDDLLQGREGADTLIGGAGNDILSGGAGNDWAVYRGGAALRIDLRLTTAQATGQGRDVLSSVENLWGGAGADALAGNAADNRLLGQDGADSLFGFDGNDRLQGGNGNDLLSAGRGNDLLLGGDGNDHLRAGPGRDQTTGGSGFDTVELTGPGGNRISLAVTGWQARPGGAVQLAGVEGLMGAAGQDTLSGHAGANTLWGGGGADQLFGLAGADRLLGGGGADRLAAGSGDDWLDGGAGNDWLLGGAGADRFVFSAGADRIADLSWAEGDHLLLSLAALPQLRGLTPTTIVERWGVDLGAEVRLDLGAAGQVTLAGMASLSELRAVIEVI